MCQSHVPTQAGLLGARGPGILLCSCCGSQHLVCLCTRCCTGSSAPFPNSSWLTQNYGPSGAAQRPPCFFLPGRADLSSLYHVDTQHMCDQFFLTSDQRRTLLWLLCLGQLYSVSLCHPSTQVCSALGPLMAAVLSDVALPHAAASAAATLLANREPLHALHPFLPNSNRVQSRWVSCCLQLCVPCLLGSPVSALLFGGSIL